MTTKRLAIWIGLVAPGLAGCSGGPDDGLAKFPVRGSVRVNGQPAGRMVVTFHDLASGAAGNAARPTSRCDDQGRFELSTNADRDGAVAGRYAVTFYWPASEGGMPADLLGGKFSRPADSRFRVEVAKEENEFGPFLLEVDAKLLDKGRKAANPLP